MIVCVFMIAFYSSAFAGSSITFAWDANTESDLAGYRLYQATTSGQYTFGDGNQVATIPAGTETVTLEDVPDGTYYWVATAYDVGGLESGPSNEVSATLDATPPQPPQGFIITLIQKILAFLMNLFAGLRTV